MLSRAMGRVGSPSSFPPLPCPSGDTLPEALMGLQSTQCPALKWGIYKEVSSYLLCRTWGEIKLSRKMVGG